MRKKFAIFLLSFLFVTSLFTTSVFAQNAEAVKNVYLKSGETIDGDYFASGDNIQIDGIVNGDAYVAGGQVTVNGIINGDLLVVAGNVRIDGEVTQDVRAGGGSIDISGKVGQNLTFGAGNINISKSAEIGGSLVGGAGSVFLAAPVGKGVKVGAGNMNVSNMVDGNIDAAVDQLTLENGASINGDVTYWGESNAIVSDQATVSGQISKKVPINYSETRSRGTGDSRGMWIYWVLSNLLFGYILIYFFPKSITAVSETVSKSFGRTLLYGLLTVVLTPFVVFLLMISILGIPLSIALVILFFLYLYISKFAVAVTLGDFALKKLNKESSLKWSLVLGMIIYAVLKLIPIVSFATSLLVTLSGLGAFVLTYKENWNKTKE